MARLVVDSSVVIKWFFVEPHSEEANRILAEYKSGALVLLAPNLLYAEVGNVIWKKHIFQGVVAVDAKQIIDEFLALDFVLTPTNALLKEAYHLAATYRRTVYDSIYIALSLQEQCRFVTADERLVNAVRPALPNVVSVVNWRQIRL